MIPTQNLSSLYLSKSVSNKTKHLLVPFCLYKYSWCIDFHCRVVYLTTLHVLNYMFRENWLFSSEKLKLSSVPKQWVLLCAQLPWPWLYLVWLGPVYLFSWYCICCESICIAPLVCSEDLSFNFIFPLPQWSLNFRGFMEYIPGVNINSNILCLLANCGTLF